QRHIPLGINLGKGKSTPLSLALGDYCAGFDATAHLADYITINISSPNTPDLRKLQKNQFLDPLLSGINSHRNSWAKLNNMASPPCLLKISPDESFKSIETIVGKAVEHKFDGIIACNTSIDPANPLKKSTRLPEGGISGKPLENRANEVIKFVSKLTDSKLPIIGSGGIYDYESAQRKLDAGACLLQIYTSFIYNGPLWPSRL
ncbi:MAG: dihydroorotate dehydrogenase (quinone), partial [Burkholderiaceae bacterium]